MKHNFPQVDLPVEMLAWRDVTEGIDYEGLPDTMQAGHEYINTAVYAVDKDTGISLKNVYTSVFY